MRETNFNTYRLLRANEMPEVEVVLVSSDATPGGIGELAVGPVAPALCNALFAATGKRLRDAGRRPRADLVLSRSRAS